ncbi:MAG: hypothetical protein WAQ27_05045 [Candidatus Microsaccharimonas sp.]
MVTREAVCAHHDVPICKAWVVAERRSELKQLIDAYKFEFMRLAAHTLVDLLDESLPLLPLNTVIVPIPTAPSHVRQRGYDHLQLLASLLSQRRELPVVRLLERSSTKTQHELNRVERQNEAAKAFFVADGVSIEPTTPLLILDDIITTGSTIRSAAQVLTDAGAKTVFVAALAYQPLD